LLFLFFFFVFFPTFFSSKTVRASAKLVKATSALTMMMQNGAALVILIPEEVSWQIQQIRSEHDKAFTRWPAHITIFFGFPFGTKETGITS
jgi:hypothetical protein